MEEIFDGKKSRERPRLQNISQIIEDQGCKSYQELKRKTTDREKRASCYKPIIRLNTAESDYCNINLYLYTNYGFNEVLLQF